MSIEYISYICIHEGPTPTLGNYPNAVFEFRKQYLFRRAVYDVTNFITTDDTGRSVVLTTEELNAYFITIEKHRNTILDRLINEKI